jgi:hypothetical protein
MTIDLVFLKDGTGGDLYDSLEDPQRKKRTLFIDHFIFSQTKIKKSQTNIVDGKTIPLFLSLR